MSNKKRIKKLLDSASFKKLQKEYERRLFFKDVEIKHLQMLVSMLRQIPRKSFPSGGWNPPLENSILVGKYGEGMISGKTANFVLNQGFRAAAENIGTPQKDVMDAWLYYLQNPKSKILFENHEQQKTNPE